MKLLRIQGEVPDPYVEQSRDFQLLCRLYDCVVNSTKFDVDSIANLTNTHDIKENMLPLLQTKLGFFSNEEIDSDALRMLLSVFPLLVKCKGSLKSIKWLIDTFLKILNIRVPITITTTKTTTRLYNIDVPDHTIIVGINAAFRDTAVIFQEVLKYILPAGFGYYVYFYSSNSEITNLLENEKVAILYVSDRISSQIASAADYASGDNTLKKRLESAVSLMEVFKYEEDTEEHPVEVVTVNGVEENNE